MDAIGEYIISVTSAALVCSCVQSIFENKGTVSSVLKLLCGIFLSLVALHPLLDIKLTEITSFTQFQTNSGSEIVSEAQQIASNEQRALISENCQTYIAQKAQELGCNLKVSVFSEPEPPYAPNGVEISGNISPYARGQLTNWIKDNLAIKAEDQRWIG